MSILTCEFLEVSFFPHSPFLFPLTVPSVWELKPLLGDYHPLIYETEKWPLPNYNCLPDASPTLVEALLHCSGWELLILTDSLLVDWNVWDFCAVLCLVWLLTCSTHMAACALAGEDIVSFVPWYTYVQYLCCAVYGCAGLDYRCAWWWLMHTVIMSGHTVCWIYALSFYFFDS